MIRAQILDLRWTEAITNEYSDVAPLAGLVRSVSAPENNESQEGDMVPVDEADIYLHRGQDQEWSYGPTLCCASPVIRYAMKEVVQDYADSEERSEYASLTDVDEY
jgi:hypothetical protein